MRKTLVILLVIEFLAAFTLGQVATVRSSRLDRAWLESQQRPTTDTRERFERQRRITELQRWGFSGVLFAVMAGATILVSRARKGEQDGAANRSQPFPSETNPTSSAAGSRR